MLGRYVTEHPAEAAETYLERLAVAAVLSRSLLKGFLKRGAAIRKIAFCGAVALALAGIVDASVSSARLKQSDRIAKPAFGNWGFDTAGMDRSVAPGDNFYDFANGAWNKSTEIPGDRPAWSETSRLAELSRQRTREVIEASARSGAAPGSNERKVGDFYASFMDEAAIESKGTAPVKPLLDEIAATRSRSELAREFGKLRELGIDSPVTTYLLPDFKDNRHYSAFVSQSGLGLPDRDYYLDEANPKFAEARSSYRQHIANVLRLAGLADPEGRSIRIFDLEMKIAKTHWTRSQSRQIEDRYNPMTRAELAANLPGLDWNVFLDAAGLAGQDRLIIAQPSALRDAARLVQSEPLDTWKDYLTFRTLSASAPMLPKAFVDEYFAFNGKVLAGTPQLPERWKRGVDLVGNGMGEAIGELYVARYFPPAAKLKAETLVHNLIAAMDARLAKVSWMSPETRSKAREKLASVRPKIGYPSKWRDYSALTIRRDDPLGNVMRASQFDYLHDVSKLGRPIDHSEWGMSPQTVNAYANVFMNEVVFPAAILQPPYFDPNADDAVNYGAIGSAIGHELSHLFDDQGRKFDKSGNLADWWTPADIAKFKALTDRLGAQYSAYEPLPGQHVKGDQTMSENIADLAGLAIAFDAYHISLGGERPPVIDGFTADQRFFLGYAQSWRMKLRDNYLQKLLTTDSHSPDSVRALAVRNLDAWYRAFDVRKGKLYLTPEQRIRIW